MSVNTLSAESLAVLLQNSRYSSANTRQSLAITLQLPKDIKVDIKATDGTVHVADGRLVFITSSQGDISSFVLDLARARSLQLSHSLESPWFGPNYWSFRFFTAPDAACSGFPSSEWFDGKIVFKDGGALAFASAVDTVINDVLNNQDIDDELPRYDYISDP
ncbi:hypothetical protein METBISCDRAFT_23558 [Metschnikowia bicuspidata]|uniref:Uncharacterized protein n=1 Tax=Metschnikowia bicuspidata TaxID=27322 RepID=A0A4P9ZDH4_9ASCO|nr:hypothetical protein METBISCDRAFT_23558 [Metschnikowia bicuspidata]